MEVVIGGDWQNKKRKPKIKKRKSKNDNYKPPHNNSMLTRGARHSSLVEEWSRSGEKVEEWSRTAIATTGPAPVTALRKHSKRLPTGVIHLIG